MPLIRIRIRAKLYRSKHTKHVNDLVFTWCCHNNYSHNEISLIFWPEKVSRCRSCCRLCPALIYFTKPHPYIDNSFFMPLIVKIINNNIHKVCQLPNSHDLTIFCQLIISIIFSFAFVDFLKSYLNIFLKYI